jgi:hypothetical protein
MLGLNPGTVATLASAIRISDYLGRSREKNCLLELSQSEVMQERYVLKEEGNVDVVIKHVNISQLQFRGKGEGERYALRSQFHPLRRYF